ncbi:acetyl-CoA-benzylalcohol acetyltransferase-like [Capsicum annuum]|uniref:acetyl-CoA-benzylalcohol acetyltransferase-like n=1 Tax=Capsicum annuum TaxID=4072 RepID=UPI001FB11B5D|nr:acetyl-CoA-benzylalcohol acetyltransferase-like [Capsicum annuum]
MAKLDIQIQKKKMIKPSTPTLNHLRTLKLSYFDQGAPRMYVPILFHYLPSSVGITERCDKLQKSLAEMLTMFYPLAGRFSEDEFSILCNDEGVEYVETKVNTDLAEFLHQGPKNIELLDDLLPTDLPSSPLLGIQVNVFNCGGLVMGIQISHILADGFTLGTFVKEWARISLTGMTKGCLPISFGGLSSLFPTRVQSGPQFAAPSNRDPNIVTKRFVFDALAIAKLRNRTNSSATFRRPTRVVAVMSLIWKVLVGISLAKHGHARDSHLLFPINLRGKSNLPSLEHALGNFYVTVVAALEANKSRKELTDFVSVVGGKTRDIAAGFSNANIDDITSACVTYGTEVVSKLGQKDVDNYPSTSWCGFPWYGADFGWGKPCWVSSVSKNYEGISLLDTKNGDGIEAWVGLKEDDMAEFERDPEILSSTSNRKLHLIPQGIDI